jgi:hypothetical protein
MTRNNNRADLNVGILSEPAKVFVPKVRANGLISQVSGAVVDISTKNDEKRKCGSMQSQ